MTPVEFSREMEKACQDARDPAALLARGRELMEQALGLNAFAYVDTIERFCWRMRELEAE